MFYKSLRPLISLVLCSALTGCGQQTYDDVSSDPKYAEMVGQQFTVVGPLLAYGIRDHSAAPIEYVTLMPPPGIAGKSIVPLGTVNAGAVVSVRAVRVTNRLVDDPVNYLVMLERSSINVSVPIHIDRFRGNEGPDGRTSLNPTIFHPLAYDQ